MKTNEDLVTVAISSRRPRPPFCLCVCLRSEIDIKWAKTDLESRHVDEKLGCPRVRGSQLGQRLIKGREVE